MTEFRSPDSLPKPFGYSHVALVPAGPLVITSGQVGMHQSGDIPSGMEAQTRLAFENLGRALEAGGAGWRDVVKLTYFVTDLAELLTVRRVRDEFLDTASPPASSLVQVAGLFMPELLIEVEAIASLGSEAPAR